MSKDQTSSKKSRAQKMDERAHQTKSKKDRIDEQALKTKQKETVG